MIIEDLPAQPSTVEGVMAAAVVASSRERDWRGIEVMQAQLAFHEMTVPELDCHTVVLNLGQPFALRARVDGRPSAGDMGSLGVKIIPAGVPSIWQWAPGSALNMLHLSVPTTFLHGVAAETGLNPDRVAIIGRLGIHDPRIERVGLLLLEELRAGGLAGRLYAESLAAVLAVHLLRTHSSLARPSPLRETSGGLSAWALRQTTAYIEDNLARDLTLAEIAGVVHLSPYHFARMFKRSTGYSPHRYLIARRVERAKELLTAGTLTVAQVAAAVGFADQSHFTRHFKALVGVTPKRFLRDRTNLP